MCVRVCTRVTIHKSCHVDVVDNVIVVVAFDTLMVISLWCFVVIGFFNDDRNNMENILALNGNKFIYIWFDLVGGRRFAFLSLPTYFSPSTPLKEYNRLPRRTEIATC